MVILAGGPAYAKLSIPALLCIGVICTIFAILLYAVCLMPAREHSKQILPPPDSLQVQERIRWSDMDTAGIMYFGTYIRLFEIAETELMRAAGCPYSNEQFRTLGIWMLRVNFHCDFFAPAFIDDLLTIHIWTGSPGRASLPLYFAVCRNQQVLGKGSCTIVATGIQSQKAVKIPQIMLDGLRPYCFPE
jgi:YbgC/YbaW family acyl-CoA thioester hydrolase